MDFLDTVDRRNPVQGSIGEGVSHIMTGHGVYGQLTRAGFDQLRALGASLRNELCRGEQLLPPRLDDADACAALAVRSTPFVRTVQSAQAFLDGLYPSHTRSSAAQGGVQV